MWQRQWPFTQNKRMFFNKIFIFISEAYQHGNESNGVDETDLVFLKGILNNPAVTQNFKVSIVKDCARALVANLSIVEQHIARQFHSQPVDEGKKYGWNSHVMNFTNKNAFKFQWNANGYKCNFVLLITTLFMNIWVIHRWTRFIQIL